MREQKADDKGRDQLLKGTSAHSCSPSSPPRKVVAVPSWLSSSL